MIPGDIIFGVGMALLGYCPGTGVAAGQEHRDAMIGIVGKLVGAGAYIGAYPLLQRERR